LGLAVLSELSLLWVVFSQFDVIFKVINGINGLLFRAECASELCVMYFF